MDRKRVIVTERIAEEGIELLRKELMLIIEMEYLVKNCWE